jgi:dolichol-phosphate mannosyltransferase
MATDRMILRTSMPLIAQLSRADVVVGYRANRKDTWSRRFASRWANRIRRLFLLDGVRDTGCSLKAFPSVYAGAA